MGIVDALRAGNFTYLANGSNTVNVTTGNGNNNINVTAGNINIQTGNGNQTINAAANNQLNIETGAFGVDFVTASASKGNITTNDSDDVIKFTGDSFDISAVGGNNIIFAKGNTDDKNTNNTINVGSGNDQIVAAANNLTINDQSGGNLTSITYGDNLKLNGGDGNSMISFWGDNNTITVGDGNHIIETADHTIRTANQGTINLMQEYGIVDALEKRLLHTSEKVSESAPVTVTQNALDEIAKKYNLSAAEKAILKSVDLNAKYSDGNPLYVLVRSPQKSTAAGKDVYVVAKRDGSTHMRAVGDNECIAVKGWDTTSVNYSNTTTQDITYEKTYMLDGVKNANITTGDGRQVITITSKYNDPANTTNVTIGDNNSGLANLINIYNGYITQKTRETVTETTTGPSGIFSMYVNQGGANGTGGGNSGNGVTWNSPLVVDFNRDGNVSAAAGKGVDIDNNGTADGAATAGDKMLAMSDINKNGKIDGAEVFGDQTVSPFTGKKLEAKNGFEALKIIAQEAKLYAGVDCMKDGNVDLQALKTVLAAKGIDLGFISDENVTELEDLAHVAFINVDNYEEKEATGDVQHRQIGTYTDIDGQEQKVDDVWFKS